MHFGWKTTIGRPALLAAIALLVAPAFGFGQAAVAQPTAATPPAVPTLDLNDRQLTAIKLAPVGRHIFAQQIAAVGSIDFNENLSVQVFPPYQGKIIEAFGQIGDEVEKGRTLYTIDSPDLVQAESTLIAAAGVLDLTSRALARAQRLYSTQGTGGIAEKDLEQAVSDKMTAEGALKAARDAVRIFGKTEAEIDNIVVKRKVDPVLVVNSPISGRITARAAQPGLFVQPGNAPAPFAIADVSTVWMLGNVVESDAPLVRVGQKVAVSVMAHPGVVYDGTITTVGAMVDPALHTLEIRSDTKDPRHELRPNMLANVVITTGDPINATALPVNGVVRLGDGTMTAWVTTDRHHFTQRHITVGLQQDGFRQIIDGLNPGELAVTDGAVFLDAMLAPSTDD